MNNLFSPKTKLYYQVFDSIYLFTPAASWHPKESVFRKLKAGNIIHEFTYEKIEQVLEQIEDS